MEPLETAAYDEEEVTEESLHFAQALFARFPHLRQHARMERRKGSDDWWTLLVKVPAPDGQTDELVIWMEWNEPSVAFGKWHAHESSCDGVPGFLDLIAGILEDRLVHCENVAGRNDGHGCLLDLTEDDALLEWLTSKDSTGPAHLRSWSGKLNREVSLDDFESDGLPDGL